MFAVLNDPKNMTADDLRHALTVLAPKVIDRATSAAVTSTLRTGRNEIAKVVKQQLNVTARDIKESLAVKRPDKIIVSLRGLPLKRFKAKQTKEGVQYRIKGKRVTRKHAFIVKKLSEHVFMRASKARLPINKQYGPTVFSNVQQSDQEVRIEDKLDELTTDVLRRRIRSKLIWQLERAMAR